MATDTQPFPTSIRAVNRLVPFVHVADVDASLDFYALLGFVQNNTLRDPAGRAFWSLAQSGNAEIMFSRASGPIDPAQQAVLFYMYSTDVAALRRHLLAKGLHDGARLADINIPGGEIAQLREMVHGEHGYPFELVGTCIGTLHPQRLLVGADVAAGDVVIGLPSSGLHSNGYTLARHALLERAGLSLEGRVAELGRTLGEELLEPTLLYVRPAMAMLDAGLSVKAFLHVTGDGLLNLARIDAPMGFVIDRPLPPQPIFALIQHAAQTSAAEMYRTFNMGTGLAVVVPPAEAERALAIAAEHGHRGQVIGYATPDAERRIWLPGADLVGVGKQFLPADGPPPAAR